jgi:predicted DNA-binding transcriptional regulator YafY
VLGYNSKYEAITNFALDRIINIEKSGQKYIPNTKYNFNEYFDKVIGVTIEEGEPEEILIEVDAAQYPYVASKPMHHSQQLVGNAENGNPIISLKVIPNFELRQAILGYGRRMAVLSPEHLKQEITKEIEDMLIQYTKQ